MQAQVSSVLGCTKSAPFQHFRKGKHLPASEPQHFPFVKPDTWFKLTSKVTSHEPVAQIFATLRL